jgi:hypothetical protein
MGASLRGAVGAIEGNETVEPQSSGSEGAPGMKRKPSIRSLDTVLLDEAMAYLDYANGDELTPRSTTLFFSYAEREETTRRASTKCGSSCVGGMLRR